jgi:hypothetical protein
MGYKPNFTNIRQISSKYSYNKRYIHGSQAVFLLEKWDKNWLCSKTTSLMRNVFTRLLVPYLTVVPVAKSTQPSSRKTCRYYVKGRTYLQVIGHRPITLHHLPQGTWSNTAVCTSDSVGAAYPCEDQSLIWSRTLSRLLTPGHVIIWFPQQRFSNSWSKYYVTRKGKWPMRRLGLFGGSH